LLINDRTQAVALQGTLAALLFHLLFFQIFALRAKIWKNESFKYLAAAGEAAYQYATE
jgi:hypothetical protein